MLYQFLDKSVEISDQEILNVITKNGKGFRKSKPTIKYQVVQYQGRPFRENDLKDSVIAYCWRMYAFYTQSSHPYVCMPVMAEFDFPGGYDSSCSREDKRTAHDQLRKQCNETVDRLLDLLPKSEWKGVIRWGQALGSL